MPFVLSRTVEFGPRAAVLGGWAVILAALAFGPAPSGAVALAATTGPAPVTDATDGVGAGLPDVSIVAPAGGATYRAGVPVQLLGGGSAGGQVLTGTALRWNVLRRSGAGAEQVAEATGPTASFVPAAGSAAPVTFEIRLTATTAAGTATASLTLHAAGEAGAAAGLQDVGTALTVRSPGFGIAGAVRFSGPSVHVAHGATAGARRLAGTVRRLPAGSRLQVALRAPGAGCSWWSRRVAGFASGSCAAPPFLTARLGAAVPAGRARAWRIPLGAALPPGGATVVLRVVDAAGRPLGVTRR